MPHGFLDIASSSAPAPRATGQIIYSAIHTYTAVPYETLPPTCPCDVMPNFNPLHWAPLQPIQYTVTIIRYG